MTREPRKRSPSRVTTSTPVASCSTDATGCPSRTSRPSAIRCETSTDPPSMRSCWAPRSTAISVSMSVPERV